MRWTWRCHRPEPAVDRTLQGNAANRQDFGINPDVLSTYAKLQISGALLLLGILFPTRTLSLYAATCTQPLSTCFPLPSPRCNISTHVVLHVTRNVYTESDFHINPLAFPGRSPTSTYYFDSQQAAGYAYHSTQHRRHGWSGRGL